MPRKKKQLRATRPQAVRAPRSRLVVEKIPPKESLTVKAHKRVLQFLNAARTPEELMALPASEFPEPIVEHGIPGPGIDEPIEPKPRLRLFERAEAEKILNARDEQSPLYGFVHLDRVRHLLSHAIVALQNALAVIDGRSLARRQPSATVCRDSPARARRTAVPTLVMSPQARWRYALAQASGHRTASTRKMSARILCAAIGLAARAPTLEKRLRQAVADDQLLRALVTQARGLEESGGEG